MTTNRQTRQADQTQRDIKTDKPDTMIYQRERDTKKQTDQIRPDQVNETRHTSDRPDRQTREIDRRNKRLRQTERERKRERERGRLTRETRQSVSQTRKINRPGRQAREIDRRHKRHRQARERKRQREKDRQF